MENGKPPTPQPGLTNAQKIQEFHAAIGSPVPKNRYSPRWKRWRCGTSLSRKSMKR